MRHPCFANIRNIISFALFKSMDIKSLVSVIVPVYNVEAYLSKCVDSILAQTYACLEVILVDDGSTDASPQICDRYATTDSRVKVIHKPNGGLSDARNAGIDAATGEYLAFVDSDDMIHARFVETLLDLARCNRAGIASVEFARFYDERSLDLRSAVEGKTMIFTSEQAIERVLYQNVLDNSACNKLYSRKVIGDLRFPVGKLYEDLALCYRLMERSPKVVHKRVGLYFYRLHEQSITGSFSLRRTDVLDITDEIVAYMAKRHHRLLSASLDRKLAANMNILWLVTRSRQSNVAVEQRCWGNIKALRFAVLSNPDSRLKNRIGALVAFLGKRTLKYFFRLKRHKR